MAVLEERPASLEGRGESIPSIYWAVISMAMKRSSSRRGGAAARDGSWRQFNMSRLLINAARQFDQRILEVINESGYPQIRLAHLHVPRNLDFEGTRLTEMAARSGLTKQTMGELVDDFEAFGLVERHPDPEDRRAKIVAFTPAGRRFLRTVRKAISDAEGEMLAKIGSRAMDQVFAGLIAFCDGSTAETRARFVNFRRNGVAVSAD